MRAASPETGKENTTLWARWRQLASLDSEAEAIVHWSGLGSNVRLTRGSLLQEASCAAGYLRDAGVRPGDVCAFILRPQPDFYPLYLGAVAAGAVPTVLAYPNTRLHPDKFTHGLKGMVQHAGIDFMLCDASLEGLLRPLVGGNSSLKALLLPEQQWKCARPFEAPERKPESP